MIKCEICGKEGFKTLKQHLLREHGITPAKYRNKYHAPTVDPEYRELRKKMRTQKDIDTFKKNMKNGGN